MTLIPLQAVIASGSCAVEIEADHVAGREYIGNVVLTACTGQIAAARASVVERDGRVLRCELTGGVSYRQSTSSDLITGSSETAIYEMDRNRLRLIGKPKLSQGAVEQYGDPIIHDVTKQSLVPEGLDDRLRVVPDSHDEGGR